MKYWVKDCKCAESGVTFKPLDMTATETDSRATMSFNIGPICCAHCGGDYKQVTPDPGARRRGEVTDG